MGNVDPEIVLYDLASNLGVCFSPFVWRIRLMLNYKRIPYRTIFVEFCDIEPTLSALGISPDESAPFKNFRYTVPAIQHVPSNKYIMGTAQIAQFLEKSYADHEVSLISDLGNEIEFKSRAYMDTMMNWAIPREAKILSHRTQPYFKQSRENMGFTFVDVSDSEAEERAWAEVYEVRREISELLQTNTAQGPFMMGEKPSLFDFAIVAVMQCARVIDESLFERFNEFPGYEGVYDACLPYMEKRN